MVPYPRRKHHLLVPTSKQVGQGLDQYAAGIGRSVPAAAPRSPAWWHRSLRAAKGVLSSPHAGSGRQRPEFRFVSIVSDPEALPGSDVGISSGVHRPPNRRQATSALGSHDTCSVRKFVARWRDPQWPVLAPVPPGGQSRCEPQRSIALFHVKHSHKSVRSIGSMGRFLALHIEAPQRQCLTLSGPALISRAAGSQLRISRRVAYAKGRYLASWGWHMLGSGSGQPAPL